MAKVFSLPDGFEAPIFDWKDHSNYQKECEDFTQKLKDWCVQRNPEQKNVGLVIKFPVADGYAEYMVAAIKPVQLIHLPFLDAYESETAELMTAKAIQEKADQQEYMKNLVPKRG